MATTVLSNLVNPEVMAQMISATLPKKIKFSEILQIQNDLGISNEVLPGQIAKITVREGKLLLVRDAVG